MTAVAVSSVPPAAMAGLGLGGTSGRSALTLSWAELADYAREAARSGGCTRPVRVRGRVDAIDLATGERQPMYDTATEPGGVLLMPCGNRRESVCPPCSQVYKQDARQLVRAGLTGGKGVPATVAGHPCVFATLTAPSFGPVHSRRMRGKTLLPCRPRRDQKERRYPHGRDISCPRRHSEDNPRLGRPLCAECYDYEAAVLFNAYAGKLWRRFTTYLPRHLARRAGLTQRQLRALVRVRYVKVAEYQERGVVHFHAVIRLDAPGEDYQPPAARFTADLLTGAIRDAAAAVRLIQGPDEQRPTARSWFSGSAPRSTPARSALPPTSCRAPAASCLSMRSPTTSPSTPPSPSPIPACRPGLSVRGRISTACAALATTSR